MADAAANLLAGNLVAFPTETVYGLGADACNAAAVARIYSVKGRPADHPLIVHVASMDSLGDWADDVREYAIALARDFWPGPMTLVVHRSALAGDFVRSKYDVKALIRQLLISRVYQLSSDPTEHNKTDQQNFARYYARRMPSEVFHDAVNQVCASRQEFTGMPRSARAVDLPHENFGSYFLDVFDRPKRVTVCECERSSSATLAQVLLLSNSDEMENKIAAGEGRVARMLKEKMAPAAMVDELFLAARGRLPVAAEKDRALAHLAGAKKNEESKVVEDLLWALVNSREFLFNH
jgi:hypothetical protein